MCCFCLKLCTRNWHWLNAKLISILYICGVFSVCSLSPDNTSETEPSDADITMATADSVTHVDSMDTDNIGHSSMVSRHSEEEIQHCLQRLLALG